VLVRLNRVSKYIQLKRFKKHKNQKQNTKEEGNRYEKERYISYDMRGKQGLEKDGNRFIKYHVQLCYNVFSSSIASCISY